MRNFTLFIAILLCVSCFSCGDSSEKTARQPQIETLGVEEVTDISAKCLGRITDSGDGVIRDYGIEIKKNSESYKKISRTKSSKNEFEVLLNDLSPRQVYNYRAFVDDGKIYYGAEKSFSTLPPSSFEAVVNPDKITSISIEISFTNTDRLNEWGFHYSNSNVTSKDPVKKSNAESSIVLDDLEPLTSYSFLPYVKDKNNSITYLPALTVATSKPKDICLIKKKWYKVDTLQQKRSIGPGISYFSIALEEYPLKVYALEIDLTNPLVQMETCLAKDSAVATERPNAMVERKKSLGKKVVAATNGDFYFYQDPIEIGIPRSGQFHNGEMVTNPTGRACFVLTEEGVPYIDRINFQGRLTKGAQTAPLHTVNMLRLEANSSLTPNLMTLYTSAFGKYTGDVAEGTKVVLRAKNGEALSFSANKEIQCVVEEIYDNAGASVIPEGCAVLHGRGTSSAYLKNLNVNDEISIYLGTTLKSNTQTSITFKEMVGGSDNIILKDGERAEGDDLYNPRTGIGYSKDKKKVYLMVADGRQTFSKGCSMKDFGEIFRSAGAWNAINLDGGGSSVMIINDQVVNNPSDGSVRAVGNSVLVGNK